MENKILQQTENDGSIKGVLSEKNLEYVYDEGKKVKAIKGVLVVSTPEHDYEIQVYTSANKADGNPNPMFKGIETIMNTYVDKANETEEKTADVLMCSVSLRENNYVGKNGKINNSTRINLNKATRKSYTEDEMEAKIRLEGIILNSTEEMSEGEDPEPTGRLKVQLGVIGYKGDIMIFDLFVPEDIASDFETYYEIGNTTTFNVKIVTKFVGKKKTAKKAVFGHTEETVADTSRGYDKAEFEIFSGDEPYEEEFGLDADLIKEAMKEREAKLQQLLDDSKKGKSTLKERAKAGEKKENPFL